MSKIKATRSYVDDHFGAPDPSLNPQGKESIGPAGPTHVGHFFMLFCLFALVLAGGGKSLWAEGAFVALTGIFLIFRPPVVTLDSKLDWTVLTLFAIGAIAFLPTGILSFLPSILMGRGKWWEMLNGGGIELPATSSPQPLVSLEAFIMLCAGLSLLYLLINCRFRVEDRWRLLQTFVIIGGILAAVVVIGDAAGKQYFFTERASSFSFFDNRNQTSILLVMIGVISLAMTMHGASMRWWWAILSGAAFLACALAVSVSLSRAGLLLFVLACGVWVILRYTLFGGEGAIRYVAPLAALSFSLMLVTGQHTLSRFDSWVGDGAGILNDARWLVYRDTVSMVAEQPATGVGLGNFSAVFPQFRDRSVNERPVVHPESDWMWIAAEMGIPGVSIFATLIFLLIWMCFPFGTDKLVPVRMAALIGVGVLLFHSLFDVSAHQLGVILIAIWIFRMAMPHLKTIPDCMIPVWAWRGMGGIFVIAGALWIFGSVSGKMVHSSLVEEQVANRVAKALEQGDDDAIFDEIETALTFRPLDWRLYLQRAQAHLYLDKSAGATNAARDDFMAARKLEPILVAPTYFEGQVWLPRSTHYAYEAWAETLNRQSENPGYMYRMIIKESRKNPRFARELDRLSQQSPEFRTVYLDTLDDERFLRALSDDLRRDPKLERFTPEQRELIMRKWLERGDPGQLIRFLETTPDAAPNSWYYRANAMARMGNYPAALELAAEYAPVPQIPAMQTLMVRDPQEQRALFAKQPTDIVRGGMLLKTQLESHDSEGAKWTIAQLLKLDNPPPYVYYWDGELNRLDENYSAAWSAWKRYLHEVIERKIELRSAQSEMFEGIDDTGDNPLLWQLTEPFQRK